MIKILFLDRDGIINIDKGYIHKSSDIELTDGITELLNTAKSLNYQFVVVTNQAGIARGLYKDADVIELHKYMAEKLSKLGFDILEFFYCPHHPQFSGECDCRKPEPGMLLQAKNKYDIDMNASVMIGDKRSDVQAGKNAGVGKCILVSGQYESEAAPEADFFAKDLYEAAAFMQDNYEA